MSMRKEASSTYHGKLDRMGLVASTASMGGDPGEGHTGPAADGTQGCEPNHRAKGYATQGEMDDTLSEKRAKPRLDRPGFKNGGAVKKGTTVNVIVAPQGQPAMPPPPPMDGPPMPMPPPAAPPMPGGGPMAGMGPPPGALTRKHGGRVPHMDAGAGSGEGRLEKVAAYGKNARP